MTDGGSRAGANGFVRGHNVWARTILPVADELGWERLLPRVGAAVTRRHQRLLAEHGLTPTSAALLAVLARVDGPSHRELAGHLALTPATLTPVVDQLEKAGDIHRERDPQDRRVVRVSITPAGRDRLRTASAAAAAGLATDLPVPPAEHADLIRAYLLDVLAGLDGG